MSHEHDGHGDHHHHQTHDHEHIHGRGHAHEHSHDHGHDQHHDHGHSHHHGAQEGGFRARPLAGPWREDQRRGFGKGKILYLDAFSGVAGDMTVAALVDLGVPEGVVTAAIAATGMTGYSLHFRHGSVGSIGALKFDVEVSGGQQERDFGTIDQMLIQADLEPGTKEKARATFRRLAEAEAAVHRRPISSVHFHEVGAVDSIADIVGAAACLDYIGATLWVSPLPMGRGFIQCRHGTIPLPAPATVGCLAGIATKDAGIEAELVTPTGAAIVGALASKCTDWPEFAPISVGWGAGSRTLADRPNLLRAVLGEPSVSCDADGHAGHVVLEANVDDSTGELAGHALSLLIEQGALDAWAVPITMKKGRPGMILSAIVAPSDEARLTALLIRETTTLGVRRHLAGRTVRPRRMIEVATRYGTVPVKVSEGPFGPPQLKPEFDACVQLAKRHATPVREILAEAIGAARQQLGLSRAAAPG